MITRVAALLVLLTALLQAAPAAPSAVSLRISAAVVSVRSEQELQRELRDRPRAAYRPRATKPMPWGAPAVFPGFASPHFERPPPAIS